jgi:hypothetical protein
MATAFPTAAGFRNIGSADMRYIPELFSGKMLKLYYDRTVLGAIANTDYEGEISKYGDTVIIRGLPTITINDYQKGQTLQHQQPEAPSDTLVIDHGKYWAFVTEKLDDKQTDIKGYIEKWAAEGAKALAKVIDTDVLAYAPTAAHASNQGAAAGAVSGAFSLGTTSSPITLTASTILGYIVDCGTVLDELNVPDEGRFFIIPPRIAGLIKKSDLKDASLSGDAKSTLRSGVLGMVDRFTFYSSNLLASGTAAGCVKMLFGTKDALSFATQMTEKESLPNPFGFGTLHRGLNVYGRKVLKSEALGVLHGKI